MLGPIGKILNLISENVRLFIILIIVLVLVWFFSPVKTSFSRFLDWLTPQPPTANVISSGAILSSLRGIGQLVAVTSDDHQRNVRVAISQGIAGIPHIGSYSADHEASGIVEAGIDFTKVKGDSLTCGETCTLIVPAPSITNCIITRLRQKDQTLAVGWRDWETLEDLGRYDAIQLFMQDVQEIGILDKAEEQIELMLGEFVSNLLEKPVDVVFEEDDNIELPHTCQPEQPFGWKKNAEGQWIKK